MEKKYAIFGIIGCALFGAGDWLLGFVNPGKVEGDVFYFISAGHGAGYAEWKIIVTLVCAVIGVLFFQQGCVHIADYMKDEKDKDGAARFFTFIDLIIVIARGKTILRKREAFLTPVTWICLIGLISMILPESSFSKGLYTFCMNGGMIVWFVREMFRKKLPY